MSNNIPRPPEIPFGWTAHWDDNHNRYYFIDATGASTWSLPEQPLPAQKTLPVVVPQQSSLVAQRPVPATAVVPRQAKSTRQKDTERRKAKIESRPQISTCACLLSKKWAHKAAMALTFSLPLKYVTWVGLLIDLMHTTAKANYVLSSCIVQSFSPTSYACLDTNAEAVSDTDTGYGYGYETKPKQTTDTGGYPEGYGVIHDGSTEPIAPDTNAEAVSDTDTGYGYGAEAEGYGAEGCYQMTWSVKYGSPVDQTKNYKHGLIYSTEVYKTEAEAKDEESSRFEKDGTYECWSAEAGESDGTAASGVQWDEPDPDAEALLLIGSGIFILFLTLTWCIEYHRFMRLLREFNDRITKGEIVEDNAEQLRRLEAHNEDKGDFKGDDIKSEISSWGRGM